MMLSKRTKGIFEMAENRAHSLADGVIDDELDWQLVTRATAPDRAGDSSRRFPRNDCKRTAPCFPNILRAENFAQFFPLSILILGT
jgi:hypothetical protein